MPCRGKEPRFVLNVGRAGLYDGFGARGFMFLLFGALGRLWFSVQAMRKSGVRMYARYVRAICSIPPGSVVGGDLGFGRFVMR